MILPDHHDIPNDLYDKFHGQFTYHDDSGVQRCKICGAETNAVGDIYGGAVYCSESGVMLFDF